ncbi:MAG: HAD-IA family hydrolase [Steroidobacteraceae bacterium]|nr:HAD-IA family hydrolase [Steroidobacteraceae bacterium]
MAGIRALLWDVDGTLAETERDGHRVAFNLAFAARGLPWRWDEARYGALLSVTGGRERLIHDMSRRDDAPRSAGEREALARELHAAKNAIYAELLRERGIPLREGVLELMRECRERGVAMGIATTTSRANVDALLGAHFGGRWTDWFAAVVCGEDVARKKPDPEAYRRALRALGVEPGRAVAVEDSPAGVAAARAAGVPVIVTRSVYFAQSALEGAAAVGPGLGGLRGWQPSPAARSAAGDARVGLDDIAQWIGADTVPAPP